MNRDLVCKRLSRIVGKKNLCRLQCILKYLLSFRNEYSFRNSKKLVSPLGGQVVVFFIDGKTIHGGLSDRLRGLFSVYYYCLKENLTFKVHWTYPFKLEDYLEPNKVNWQIDAKDISHNKNEIAFRFFNSYSLMNNNEKSYFKIMDTRKRQLHVYSNVTLHEEMYHIFFNDLFKPSKVLSEALQYNLDAIGGRYVSVTFRFIGILGDYKDTLVREVLQTNEDRERYINKCLDFICSLREKHSGVSKILVTSDSSIFLDRAARLHDVYVVPGEVVHMDSANKNLNDLKAFLDMLMISKAECCYSYCYGKMFQGTKFARTSALIGNRKFVEINES